MVDYKKLAFSNMRSLLWQELKSSSILDENDYWAESFSSYLIPIIPSQQVPEFQNLLPGAPYIVYDIETLMYSSDYWICEEEVTLTIVSNDYGKIFEIIELSKDLFRRYDYSAADINNLGASPFKFLNIYLSGIMSPDYGENEGGVLAGTVKLSYQYVRDIKSNGRFSS